MLNQMTLFLRDRRLMYDATAIVEKAVEYIKAQPDGMSSTPSWL